MSFRRLIIARHGNTFDPGDVVTRVGARTDLSLSASGKRQAALLADYFSQNDYQFTQAYCSKLKRTRDTLLPILEKSESPAKVEELAFLTEVDYGPDENKPEAEVIARLGEAALQAWDQRAKVPDGWIVNPEHITRSWAQFFRTLRKNAVPDGDVIVVTSNGIARFVPAALGISNAINSIKLSTAAFAEFEVSPTNEHLELIRWNARSTDL